MVSRSYFGQKLIILPTYNKNASFKGHLLPVQLQDLIKVSYIWMTYYSLIETPPQSNDERVN